jgi:hypothetical protein
VVTVGEHPWLQRRWGGESRAGAYSIAPTIPGDDSEKRAGHWHFTGDSPLRSASWIRDPPAQRCLSDVTNPPRS